MNEQNLIAIRLTSKQETFSFPSRDLTVPISTNVNTLNETLNQLLEKTQTDYLKPITFDFIVKDELLRKTLGEHLKEKSVSTESIVEVEYFQRTTAPVLDDSIQQEDWVSCVHTCAGKWILTGCYDRSVSLWNSSRKPIVSLSHHSNIVKDVKWINKEEPQNGFISVSFDNTAILWHWEEGTSNAEPLFTLKGHSRGVECVNVSKNTQKLATGSWDTTIKIWSASLQNEDEPAIKRSKNETNIDARNPINTLEGHKEAVTSVQWIDQQNIITSSMDHTVKVWDVEVNVIQNELVGQKAFLSSSWSPLTNSLLTSSADQYIRLYDPRSNESFSCEISFTSHTQWVSSVEWSPHSEHLFISGGYDSKVKMWDTRSPKECLYDLQNHDGQVLKVDWSNRNYIFSAGTDNFVHMYSC